MDADRLTALARALLVVQDPEGRTDPWLWEHTERVVRYAHAIAGLPELSNRSVDATALTAAALFHDAGWVVQYRQGQLTRFQLGGKPTNDLQRELGGSYLVEHAGHIVPQPSLDRAREAIRQTNYRDSAIVEAQILADAENLDDIGSLYLLKQLRQYAGDGRGVEQLLNVWARQHEYHYWDVRLKEFFRFESVRQIARARLAAVDRLMSALLLEHRGDDIRRAGAPGA